MAKTPETRSMLAMFLRSNWTERGYILLAPSLLERRPLRSFRMLRRTLLRFAVNCLTMVSAEKPYNQILKSCLVQSAYLLTIGGLKRKKPPFSRCFNEKPIATTSTITCTST